MGGQRRGRGIADTTFRVVLLCIRLRKRRGRVLEMICQGCPVWLNLRVISGVVKLSLRACL